MTGNFIPDGDSVVRLCGGSHLDPDTGSPGPGAFMLREGEDYLSVNWLEYFKGYDHQDALLEIRRVLATKRTIGKTARLALLNVGGVKQTIVMDPPLTFTHEPIITALINDSSHSAINNIQGCEQLVAEALSQAVLGLSAARAET